MTEIAWAAGWFDGEGFVGVDKRRNLYLNIAQTKTPELLLRFVAAVGRGTVGGPYGPYQKKEHSPFWVARAHGADVVDIYERLLPILGSVKRRQFADAIASAHPVGKRFK